MFRWTSRRRRREQEGVKRTDTPLSFLESTIPGTVWATYVHVHIYRRITRSMASKLGGWTAFFI